MAEQVLVLGVGNILFSDEAIGVRTVEHLQQCASLPGNVELMDGGTLGIRLMDAIMGCDLLIVVDAVLGGGEPGTLYRLEGEGAAREYEFPRLHASDGSGRHADLLRFGGAQAGCGRDRHGAQPITTRWRSG